MRAEEIMEKNVITVNENLSIEELAKVLTENKISGVPVVDDDENLVGIVTEGDLLHKETNPRVPDYLTFLGGFMYYGGIERYREDFKKLAAFKASEIMTRDLVTINKDTDIKEIASLMIKYNIKRVPVIEDKKVIGIVSRSDIVETLMQS